jgi:hypothetical protein
LEAGIGDRSSNDYYEDDHHRQGDVIVKAGEINGLSINFLSVNSDVEVGLLGLAAREK